VIAFAPADAKPPLGYTGERWSYAHGYEVRTRVDQVEEGRLPLKTWRVRTFYDIFHKGLFVLAASSVRLAEEYIAAHPPRRLIGRN
jgi:hypothetical protein